MSETFKLTRAQLASFLNNNHMLIRAFEALFADVVEDIPGSIEDAEQLISLIQAQLAATHNPDARLLQLEMLATLNMGAINARFAEFDRRIRQLELLATMELA